MRCRDSQPQVKTANYGQAIGRTLFAASSKILPRGYGRDRGGLVATNPLARRATSDVAH